MFKNRFKFFVFVLLIILFISFFDFHSSADSYDFSTIVMSVKHPLELGELNVEGYTIYTNNINYGVVGAYTITYQEKNDKNVFVKRDVYIIDDENTTYNSFGVEETREFEIENFVSMDKRMINDSDYYLIIQYKHLEKYDIRVYLIIDGEIYFQNNFYPYEYLDSFVSFDEFNRPIINMIIIDCFDVNENIKLLSLDYNEDETLTNFNLDRCLFIKYNPVNNGLYLIYKEKIVEIKVVNNKIIRTVNINASSLGYKFVNASLKEINDDFYYCYLYLDENNNVYYYQLLNKELEIYKTVTIDNTNLRLYNNVYINENCNHIFSYEIDNIITIDSEVGIFKYKIYSIDNEQVLKNQIEFNSCISDLELNTYGEMINIKIETEDGNTHSYKVFWDIVIPNNDSSRVYEGDYFYEYSNSNQKLYTGLNKKLDLVYVNKQLNNNGVLIKLEHPIIFINGYECKLDFSLDYEKYGRYITNANLELDGFRVNLGHSYYVFDMCNVRDNETYQIGTKICFVGEGKLNGIGIESGYKINEIGNYVLIIKGVDEEKYVSFEVKNLNEESIEVVSTDNEIARIDNNYTNSNKTNEERNSSYINNESNDEMNPYLYIVMTVIITSIFIIGLKIIIKRKENNHAK